jgi:hypothetical protein
MDSPFKIYFLKKPQFSPILTLLSKQSGKSKGLRKFPTEKPSYILVYGHRRMQKKSFIKLNKKIVA